MNIHNILSDHELYDEIDSRLNKNQLGNRFPIMRTTDQVRSIIRGVRERAELPDIEVESIVRRFGRPVLFIQNDTLSYLRAKFYDSVYKIAGTSSKMVSDQWAGLSCVNTRSTLGLALVGWWPMISLLPIGMWQKNLP